ESLGDEVLRGIEVQRRPARRALDRGDAAAGNLADRLHLSEGNACGTRPAAAPVTARAQPHGATADGVEPGGPGDRSPDHGQRAEATDDRSDRCARIVPGDEPGAVELARG